MGKNKSIACFFVGLNIILFVVMIMVWTIEPLAAEEKETHSLVELTEEEQKFVDRGEEIVIGCPVDSCPLLFQEEDTGDVKGITVDILDVISESTGLKFRYEALPSGSVTYQTLQDLQVDLVASVEYHKVNEQAVGIVMTDPYLHTAKVFVCKKGVVLDSNKNMVIAVCSGSQTLSKVLKDIYPNFRVDYYNSMEEALSALLDGRADAVLQYQYSLQRILAKPIYDDLRVLDEAGIGDSHCLAALVPVTEDKQNIVQDDTKLLLSVLNKGIASLDEDEVSFFIIKESAENVYQYTIEDFLYRYRYSVIIIGIALILITFLLWQVHVLQKKRAEQLATEKWARELSVVNEQMKEQQVLLKRALEHAEAGNRAKTSFLFNMSHDIRTPMNAILGQTMIALKHREEPDKIIESVQKIDEFGKHLMNLLNNVLDMSRIENNEVRLLEDVCDLCDVVDNIKDDFKNDIKEKKLTVQVDTTKIKNRKVYCDEMHFRRIILNLLSNAVKFSNQKGVVTVSLRQSDSELEGAYAYEISIKDNGIGMSQEFLQHMFEPFERERSSTVSGVYGTGLGMSITRSLVDLMNGTIKVVSELNKGTESIVCFIFKAADESEIEQKQGDTESKETETPEGKSDTVDEIDFKGKRILVVEDVLVNAEFICEILGEMGFDTETAENGKIAVEKVKNSEPGYYNIVLMDIQMPVMNGYQATEEIRRLAEKEHASLPIIALTANAFEEDKKNALASGMNAHLAKPVDIGKLIDTINGFL